MCSDDIITFAEGPVAASSIGRTCSNLLETHADHDQQKRIITVREAARSQGFPDSHVFESINTKPSKIIDDVRESILVGLHLTYVVYFFDIPAIATDWKCSCCALCTGVGKGVG